MISGSQPIPPFPPDTQKTTSDCYSFSVLFQMATDLFRSENFVPYNQTQEPIFPPELLVFVPISWYWKSIATVCV